MAAHTRRIALRLEYDGTGLCGWQRQPNGPTVQEHLESALATLLGSPHQVVGASRTDAGVHAEGQVCHFDLDAAHGIDAIGIARGLTSQLPASIAVSSAHEVTSDFHSRFSALGKHYRYEILNRPIRSPLAARTSWHVRAPLDEAAMATAAAALIGEHEFDAFRATGCSANTTRRTIESIEVGRPSDPEIIVISVRGNAFLRNMVRIIVGTLSNVGRGRMTPQDIETTLKSRDRTRAGQTAPAQGLTLVRVFYEAP